ncbi:MAG: N-glycosylase/DNA lyase, partial [Gemmataceae bacterium]
AEQVGRALGELPAAVYDSADRWDPEWPVLEKIAALPRGADVLLTLALALSDYQLGVGGATAYWAAAPSLLERFPPDDAGQVYEFMFELMQRPVAARLGENKLRRVKRLVDSEVPQLTSGGVESVDAVALWPALAKAASADGDRNAKTIVFALKTLGLLHLAATGRRLALPEQLPIPVDLRVARVSLSAGLIGPPPGVSVLEAIENVEPLIESNRVQMIEAWTEAAANVGLSAAEIDSLIWQLGEPLYAHRHSRADAEAALQAHLQLLGAPGPAARAAAHELTQYLEG